MSRELAQIQLERLEDRLLLSAGNLSTVLNWVQDRQITSDPLAPGYGAWLSHHDPGRYDGSTQVYLQQWYFADVTVSSLLQARVPGSLSAAELYLECRLSHTDANTGLIDDQWFLADGSRPTEVTTRAVDAVDSTAAMTLETLWQFWQAGGDASFFDQPGRKALLEKIGQVMIDLQQDDGLTWATPTYLVKYLADNVEVLAGLRALANIERTVYGDSVQAEFFDVKAAEVEQGIRESLFDGSHFALAKHSGGNVDAVSNQWYPTAHIVWPAIFDMIDARTPEAREQLDYLNSHWDWSNSFVAVDAYGNGVPWASVGYAALRSQDVTRAQSQMNFLLAEEFPTETSATPIYPFITAEAGWMIRTLSMPYWSAVDARQTDEDEPLLISGLNMDTLADVETRMRVSLSVEHGGLSFGTISGLTFITGDGADDASVTFEGTATSVNAALAQLTYQPTADYFGVDELSLHVAGLGAGRSGGLSDARLLAIEIAAINDPPVASGNSATAGEDGPAVAGNVLTDGTPDADVEDEAGTLVVSAVNGQSAAVGQPITLPSGALLTVQSNGAYSYDPNGGFERLFDGENAVDTFTYTVRDLQGGATSATVEITILGANDPLTILGNTAHVLGTDEDDVIELKLTERQVVINSVVHDLAVEITELRIDGLAGEDTLTIQGTAGDETVRLLPAAAFLDNSSDGTTGRASSVETIVFNGHGGHDLARFWDSAGDDEYTAGPSDARMIGSGFDNTAHAAANIGYSVNGYDVAYLLDGVGDDRFLAWSNRAALMGGGFVIQVFGFVEVTATASLGVDRAILNDSAGDDLLVTTPTAANRSGATFSNQAESFEWYLARSLSGRDVADLYGGGTNDTFTGRPGIAVMTGSGFNVQVEGFAAVAGYGQGGNDLGRFYGGAGADVYVGRPGLAELSGPGYVLQAHRFSRMFGVAKGTDDIAYLFDSAYDDTFTGYSNFAELKGGGVFHRLTGFAEITGFGSEGGTNFVVIYPRNPVRYLLNLRGQWT